MGWKKDLKDMWPNLLTYSFVILLIVLLPYRLWWFLFAIVTPFIVKDLIIAKSFKAIFTRSYLLNIPKTLALSTIVFYLAKYLGRKGWWGFLIIILGFSFFKLYLARDYYMSKVREIETIIWGKPNDRRKKNE